MLIYQIYLINQIKRKTLKAGKLGPLRIQKGLTGPAVQRSTKCLWQLKSFLKTAKLHCERLRLLSSSQWAPSTTLKKGTSFVRVSTHQSCANRLLVWPFKGKRACEGCKVGLAFCEYKGFSFCVLAPSK